MRKKVIQEAITKFGVNSGWDYNLTSKTIAPSLADHIDKALVDDAIPT